MQTNTSRQSNKKSMVDSLVDLGYTKENANKIYESYKSADKLFRLKEYIDVKISTTDESKYSYPMRDM